MKDGTKRTCQSHHSANWSAIGDFLVAFFPCPIVHLPALVAHTFQHWNQKANDLKLSFHSSAATEISVLSSNDRVLLPTAKYSILISQPLFLVGSGNEQLSLALLRLTTSLHPSS